ncbi:response regulator [Aureimonas fodinaquatilis]|uniref:Response regulator n=1 Tax=Aureimonas fodinaquatilis TaxID=2565783 RepID=A0A5B0E161_9HYPH|nr:response regulator [Aureimonas fodinaquatilis]KAA0972563.1 response regulator [Aureimonas fodinaquatilis]
MAQLDDEAHSSGLRVFIVEDETLVAMQLEDMLFDLGCEVVGLAMRLQRACDMVQEVGPISVAVLDVNINGEKVFPVAQYLRGKGVPLVFTTGYGRSGLEGAWDEWPVLSKPYTMEQLSDAMQEAVSVNLSGLSGGSDTPVQKIGSSHASHI